MTNYHRWILATLYNDNTPSIWQLKRLGSFESHEEVCEGCGYQPTSQEIREGTSRPMYRTKNISDPDGHDPEIVYCQECLELVQRTVNNFEELDDTPKTYMYPLRVVNA